jgi:hypothetical protein
MNGMKWRMLCEDKLVAINVMRQCGMQIVVVKLGP